MTVFGRQFTGDPPQRAAPKPLTERFPDHEVGQMGSVTDIANMLGVGSTAVSNWINRHNDFPKPSSVIGHTGARQTGIWNLEEVRDWHKARGGSTEPTAGSAGAMY